MPWRDIAAEKPFSGMPVRTLWKMHKEQKIPKKWRKHLELPALVPAPVCPTCNIVHLAECKEVTKMVTKRGKYKTLKMKEEELHKKGYTIRLEKHAWDTGVWGCSLIHATNSATAAGPSSAAAFNAAYKRLQEKG